MMIEHDIETVGREAEVDVLALRVEAALCEMTRAADELNRATMEFFKAEGAFIESKRALYRLAAPSGGGLN